MVISFITGVTTTYSQSINYLHSSNGAFIPTATPEINYFGPDPYGLYGVCAGGGWQWIDALCSVSAVNSPDSSVKSTSSQGSTWNTGDGTVRYMVVDLGAVRTFNELRVFQMFSDGKVTHVAMYVYPDTTPGLNPIFSDASWSSVLTESEVNPGVDNIPVVTGPSVFTLPETTARYVKFEFRNDGRYGNGGFVEVRELKLFNNPFTGINNVNNKNQVSIYPNPTKGMVNIYLPESAKNYTVEVYSVVGNMVAQLTDQPKGKVAIDLTANTRGIYFIKILQGNETITVDKLVIR